jgi:uncharacterized membrane protein
MAGIGFELRKLLKKDTLLGLLQAYTFAGIIGSGPWVLSILGILIIGLLSSTVVVPSFLVTQFQTSVTYLIATSLILTGGLQLGFTRFVSDRLFENRDAIIAPNLNGVLLLIILVASAVSIIGMFVLLPGTGVIYRILMLAAFVLMCAIWIMTIFLSGMKRYKAIVALFAIGYAITVSLALLLRSFGLEGLMAGFVIGHCVLLAGMWVVTIGEFRPRELVAFDFAKRGAMFSSLLSIGFLYNLGIWADKFMLKKGPGSHIK